MMSDSSFGKPVVDTYTKKKQSYEIGKDGPSRFKLDHSIAKPGKGSYGIRVVTGKMIEAGTSRTAKEFVRLVGNKAASEKIYLTGIFFDIDRDEYFDLVVETKKSLGEIQVVNIGIDGGFENAWFVQYSVVYNFDTYEEKETQFPCYHWIDKKQCVTTTSKTATPNQVASNEILENERRDQLIKRKQQYQWQKYTDTTGLPSSIKGSTKDLPDDEEFGFSKNVDFVKNVLEGALKTQLAGVLTSVDDLGDYADLFKGLEDKVPLEIKKAGRWTSDVEFGRQILNGVNPVVIEKCTKIPENFHVTGDLVAPFLTRGKTLTQEIEAGNVFICDMKIMEDLTPRKGQYVAAPICLLYVNSSQQLVPIAIQCKQGKKEGEISELNPVFVPTDNWIDWLLAKIYYQSAHAQFHQISTHYQSCHAAMEAYGVATMRNLPDSHPVQKLLRPHFRYTMAVNSRARETLISENGIIASTFAIGPPQELMKKASPLFSVDWTNIEESVKKRGLENIPEYYYRDDGLKVFRAIKEYVATVVNLFYASEEEVGSDEELKVWAEDIHKNAFPPSGHGFPIKIDTRAELIKRCTVIIFTGSAQHASVNFGQYAIYGYVPNAPFTLRLPPPTKKGVADYQRLLDTLPTENDAKLSINIAFALSEHSNDEVYLGHFPFKRFLEEDVQTGIAKLQDELKAITREIEDRNKEMDIGYTYMDPTGIPNSITI